MPLETGDSAEATKATAHCTPLRLHPSTSLYASLACLLLPITISLTYMHPAAPNPPSSFPDFHAYAPPPFMLHTCMPSSPITNMNSSTRASR